MRFTTLSAILRGAWLIDPAAAQQFLPLVAGILTREQPIAEEREEEEEQTNFKPLHLNAAAYVVGRRTDLSMIPQNSTAVVNLTGPVVRYVEECSNSASTEALTQLLTRLDYADNISSIVLNINSPGGEASGTGRAADVISAVQKPILGLVDDGMAASAAYWIGSATDELYATSKLSSFGSIGAYVTLGDFTEAFAKKGIKMHEVYAPQSVDKNKTYRDAINGNYAGLESDLAELVDVFIGSVKAGRKGKLNLSAGDPFTGKMYKAPQAMKIGLIDGIMSMDAVLARAEKLGNNHRKQKTTNPMATTKPAGSATPKKREFPRIAAAIGEEENGITLTGNEVLELDAEEANLLESELTFSSILKGDLKTAKNTINELQIAAAGKDQEIANLKTQVQNLTAERDSFKQKAEELGNQPANGGSTLLVKEDPKTAVGASTVKLDPTTEEAKRIYEQNQARRKSAK